MPALPPKRRASTWLEGSGWSLGRIEVVGETEGEIERDAEGVGVVLGEGVSLDVEVGVRLFVGDTEGVSDAVGVCVGARVFVIEALAVMDWVGVMLIVALIEALGEIVIEIVRVAVIDIVGEIEALAVMDLVGVMLIVALTERVAETEADGVMLIVALMERVGVVVTETVGAGEAVQSCSAASEADEPA